MCLEGEALEVLRGSSINVPRQRNLTVG